MCVFFLNLVAHLGPICLHWGFQQLPAPPKWQSSSGSSSFYLWCRAESLRVTWLSWGDSRPAGHFSFRCRPARNTWLEELFHVFFFYFLAAAKQATGETIWAQKSTAQVERRTKARGFTQPHIEWKESEYLQVRNVQHGRKVAAALKLFAVLSTNGAPPRSLGAEVCARFQEFIPSL